MLRIRKNLIALCYPIIATLIVLILWTLIVWVLKFPEYILPAPIVILEDLFSTFISLLPHAWITIEESILGFFLSVIVGFFVAVFIVWSQTLKKAILPLLVFLQTMPKIAIAPLFVIWFGFGILPKVIMSFLVCFFPIVINTSVGLASVENDMLDLIKSMSATKGQIFSKLRVPNALPYFFTSLKIAITLALIGAIVGEFVGGEAGLGYLILVANARLDAPRLFAIVVVLAFIGALLFYVVSGLERFIMPWNPAKEEGGTTVIGGA